MSEEMTTLKYVDSSMIRAIGHDPATNTLTVEFPTGVRYEYPNITADHHDALMTAPSIGKHFNMVIKGLAGTARKIGR